MISGALSASQANDTFRWNMDVGIILFFLDKSSFINKKSIINGSCITTESFREPTYATKGNARNKQRTGTKLSTSYKTAIAY